MKFAAYGDGGNAHMAPYGLGGGECIRCGERYDQGPGICVSCRIFGPPMNSSEPAQEFGIARPKSGHPRTVQ